MLSDLSDFDKKTLGIATLAATLMYAVHEIYHPTIGPFFDSSFVEYAAGSLALGALAVAGDYLHSLAVGHDFKPEIAGVVFVFTAGLHQLFHDVLDPVVLSLSGIMAVASFVGVLILSYAVK